MIRKVKLKQIIRKKINKGRDCVGRLTKNGQYVSNTFLFMMMNVLTI